MTNPLVLSVLDQSPVSEGSTGADALRNTLDLARLADELGYHRYWLAEHHGGTMLAGPSPEVLIGPVAAATERIRVGSGGVMLPHYSPLKVAESFSILARPLPRPHRPRHRPGAGHRPADDLRAAARPPPGRAGRLPDAARRAARPTSRTACPHDHPFARLAATCPACPHAPEPWLLGSSPQSGDLGRRARPALRLRRLHQPHRRADRGRYRERLRETGRAAGAAGGRGVWAICAETDEEAQRLAASARMAMTLLRRGRLIPVPPAEKALRFLSPRARRSTRCRPAGARWSARRQTVAAGLRAVAEEYGADEVVVVSITYDHDARRRSYELIAEALDLAGAPLQTQQIAS